VDHRIAGGAVRHIRSSCDCRVGSCFRHIKREGFGGTFLSDSEGLFVVDRSLLCTCTDGAIVTTDTGSELVVSGHSV